MFLFLGFLLFMVGILFLVAIFELITWRYFWVTIGLLIIVAALGGC